MTVFKLHQANAVNTESANIEIIAIVLQFLQILSDEEIVNLRVLIAALWHENPDDFWMAFKILVTKAVESNDTAIIEAMWGVVVNKWRTKTSPMTKDEEPNMEDSIAGIASLLSEHFTNSKKQDGNDNKWLWRTSRKTKRSGSKTSE